MRCEHLTAFVDVQGECLFWIVVAWQSDFTGFIVDYGCFPDQQRAFFTLRDAKRTLTLKFAGMGLEGRIYAALQETADLLLGQTWRRDDGSEMKIEKCLVDANWGEPPTIVVNNFCRQSKFADVLLPSHGRGIGAVGRPISQWSAEPGESLPARWQSPGEWRARRRPAKKHVIFDTNIWKSFIARGLEPRSATKAACRSGRRRCTESTCFSPSIVLLNSACGRPERARSQRMESLSGPRQPLVGRPWLRGHPFSSCHSDCGCTGMPKKRLKLSEIQAAKNMKVRI